MRPERRRLRRWRAPIRTRRTRRSACDDGSRCLLYPTLHPVPMGPPDNEADDCRQRSLGVGVVYTTLSTEVLVYSRPTGPGHRQVRRLRYRPVVPMTEDPGLRLRERPSILLVVAAHLVASLAAAMLLVVLAVAAFDASGPAGVAVPHHRPAGAHAGGRPARVALGVRTGAPADPARQPGRGRRGRRRARDRPPRRCRDPDGVPASPRSRRRAPPRRGR